MTRSTFCVPEAGGESPQSDTAERSAHVLVAESDGVAHEHLATTLRQAGFQVETASDGLETIGRLESSRYDALVLDLHLPRLDGLGVLGFLSSHQVDLLQRTTVVSGLTLSEIRALYPVCGTIPKPVTGSWLVELVKRCLAMD